MRLPMRILFIALLGFIFISCNDNPNEEGAYGELAVKISHSDYEIVTVYKGYYDPSFINNYNEYYYGMRLILKLDNPGGRHSVHHLSLTSAKAKYVFNYQELEEAFSDSAGGYVLDFISMEEIRTAAMIDWNILLFDEFGNSSEPYSISTEFTNLIWFQECKNVWISHAELEFTVWNCSTFDEKAIAEIHFLNSNDSESEVTQSPITDKKWTASDIPADAVNFYFIIKDECGGEKRRFISAKYAISGRTPDNIEFINEIIDPAAIVYLSDLDKYLTLSINEHEVCLLNYDDNSIVWKRHSEAAPLACKYSPENKLIYVGYINSVTDTINPADGSGNVFYPKAGMSYMALADDYLLLNSSHYYDYAAKRFKEAANIHSDGEILYNPYTNYIYAHNNLKKVESSRIKFSTYDMVNYELVGAQSINYISNLFQTLDLSPDNRKIFTGEGPVFNCAPASSGVDLTYAGTLDPSIDMTFISDNYIAAINPVYIIKSDTIPAALSIYNFNYELLGRKSRLPGKKLLKIFHKGNEVRIFSVWDNNVLVSQKFAIDEIITNSNKINRRKIYKMKNL